LSFCHNVLLLFLDGDVENNLRGKVVFEMDRRIMVVVSVRYVERVVRRVLKYDGWGPMSFFFSAREVKTKNES
jgi:hypothetical protein